MKKPIELTWRERMACRIMGKLKYNKEDKFYKCRQNDTILTVAELLLRRDPIKFAIDLLGIEKEEVRNSGLTDL